MKPEDFGVENVTLIDADTLSGDIRDALLSHVRMMRVPWALLASDEQSDIIEAITKSALNCVRECAKAIANRGFEHVEVVIGKVAIDKSLEMKITAANTLDNITKVASHGKMGAILVLAEASEFMGERSSAVPDPDQPSLPMSA